MGDTRRFRVRTTGGADTILMSADEVLEAAAQGRLMIGPHEWSTLSYGDSDAGAEEPSTADDQRRGEGAVPSVVERVREIMGRVPPEAWASVPEDLIENLDHYIYGTPKR